jgi:hypothetical protein
MTMGTVYGSSELRSWALLVSILSACLGVVHAIQLAADGVTSYIKTYVFQVFEDGFRGGVEQGREMEAAERFIASSAERN